MQRHMSVTRNANYQNENMPTADMPISCRVCKGATAPRRMVSGNDIVVAIMNLIDEKAIGVVGIN